MVLGCDEADMQFVHTVATDRYAVFRCSGGRLEPSGYSATVGRVGLQVGQFGSITSGGELMNGVQVLAHR